MAGSSNVSSECLPGGSKAVRPMRTCARDAIVQLRIDRGCWAARIREECAMERQIVGDLLQARESRKAACRVLIGIRPAALCPQACREASQSGILLSTHPSAQQQARSALIPISQIALASARTTSISPMFMEGSVPSEKYLRQ